MRDRFPLLLFLFRVADGDAEAVDALQDPDDGCLRPAKSLSHAFRITTGMSDLHDHCSRPASAARRKTSPHVRDGIGERSASTISAWRSSLLSWKSQRLACPPL